MPMVRLLATPSFTRYSDLSRCLVEEGVDKRVVQELAAKILLNEVNLTLEIWIDSCKFHSTDESSL